LKYWKREGGSWERGFRLLSGKSIKALEREQKIMVKQARYFVTPHDLKAHKLEFSILS